jgi:hypothetical protein
VNAKVLFDGFAKRSIGSTHAATTYRQRDETRLDLEARAEKTRSVDLLQLERADFGSVSQ